MHPVLFEAGPITVYTYGLLVSIAFVVCGALVVRSAPSYGVERERALDLVLVILISGVAGARLLHVALNMGYYGGDLIQIIMIQKGGLAIQGGIAAAAAAGAVFFITAKQPLWPAGDLVMRYLPLGQAIGRIGCFFNGCCYGLAGHPTQLYYSTALFIIFLVLSLKSRRRLFDGEVALLYFLLYCPARVWIDYYRADLSAVACGLTLSQLISAALFFAALILYLFKRRAS